MLWSRCMCFLKSLRSSTLNDIHHMKFFAIHKRSCYGHMNHMNFFAIHKKSCYGQRACVFSSRCGLQLWMTFITWSFSLFIKNHVMVNVHVFSQVIVVFNCEWHSRRNKKLNDIQHMNLFALHKKSCYGQRACVFSSRCGLQLWMTFITWSFLLIINNNIMVNVNVFSQVVVIFNSEWHSSLEVFRYS